ncbi:MAG: DUF3050 domain-containing protein [Bacteroidia bacterium]|nr:DUF3050 domain-containing protein [Bacteroidia bacterium]MDG2042445.1 DUF3050 domain-containing protein [Bacteroidia bacterium]
MNNVKHVEDSIADLRYKLQNHVLYQNLENIEDVKVFMENHVFAVWDFMSLLKALQIKLTSIGTPWLPSENAKLSRFINEIVIAEESDINEEGVPKSHFQMYLDAMNQVGANTEQIDNFIQSIKNGNSPLDGLSNSSINLKVSAFVKHTFSVIDTQQAHKIASAFTFGREDVIPDMFIKILDQSDKNNEKYNKLRYYLQRHIELDGDDHGPLSLMMIEELCGNDDQKWFEVQTVARESLQHRIALWDVINQIIEKKNNN